MADKKPAFLDRLFGRPQPPRNEGEGHEPPPGPPEASVDYIEDLESREEPHQAEPSEKGPGWLQRLASGLKRSSDQLTGGIAAVFTKKKLDQAMLDELEDLLIQSDFGIEMATKVVEALRRDRFDRDISPEEVREVLAAEIAGVLEPVAKQLALDPAHKPFVILMVGVNGTGKTTTIGKLAGLFAAQGKNVMLAAG